MKYRSTSHFRLTDLFQRWGYGLYLIAFNIFCVTDVVSNELDCQSPVPYTPEVVEHDSNEVFRSHAIAMHGMPKYAIGFDHFDYVNPFAEAGGRLTIGRRGTFDSFHPFIDKGNPVSTGSVETLTVASSDEPFTQYGLLASTMEWPADRSWITFHLNEDARWHDGVPVSADDVIWTFETLLKHGQPFYRFYYSNVQSAEKTGEKAVTFRFVDQTNRELPLIMGQLPVLPKHYWQNRDFTKPTLEPPLGSGPYRVTEFEPGRFVTLEKVNNYWGQDLAVRRGSNNFDQQHIKFYRDETAIRLSLKAGEIDLRVENQAKAWALDYDIEAVKKGWLKKRIFSQSESQGMQAFIVNLRKSKFKDPLVRQALDHAFDFEWTNKNLFFSQYTRTKSYWPNSDLAARGSPTGEEARIINHYRSCLPAGVDTQAAPRSDRDNRANVEIAADLLMSAGYEMQDFRLVNATTRQPFEFEILYSSPTFERIVLPYVRTLKKLGITASARIVDQSQYITRLRSFDFDMIWSGWSLSESPGNELRDFFGSEAADNPASRNYPGIKDPVVDQVIELIIAANNRQQLVERTRALDRILLARSYVIPNWHLAASRVLYWDKFGLPEIIPAQGPVVNAWWIDQNKASRLQSALRTDRPIVENLSDRRTPGQDENRSTQDTVSEISGHMNGSRWVSALFPMCILLLEVFIIVKLHRFLNRRRIDETFQNPELSSDPTPLAANDATEAGP